MLTLEGRVAAYLKVFPRRSPLVIHNEALYGTWVLGRAYCRDRQDYYGAYPNKLRELILSLFPDIQAHETMHLFSGVVPNLVCKSYDMKPETKPTICDDVRNLENHAAEFADVKLVMADPPYEKTDFEKYGVPYLDPRKKYEVLKSLARVLKAGSYVAWLDTRIPQWSREDFILRGYIGVVVGTATRMRVWSLFEVKEKELKGAKSLVANGPDCQTEERDVHTLPPAGANVLRPAVKGVGLQRQLPGE